MTASEQARADAWHECSAREVFGASGRTWIEPEEWTYPSGGFLRRACVRLRANSVDPGSLPDKAIGTYRIVRASVADTYFTIPARLRIDGKTIKGFISVDDDNEELTFTPENRSANAGDYCRREG